MAGKNALRSIFGFAAALGMLSAPPIAQAQDDSAAESVAIFEEIVVTALKRGGQALSDVPLSVSAIGGDQIEGMGANSLIDLIQLAPGTTMIEGSPGDNRIQIRGVGGTPNFTEPTVAFYLDETPFQFLFSPILPDVRAFDLERVEILRGPQGTLYGAGAAGGVVRVIAKQPDLENFQAKADVTYSNTSDGGNNGEVNAAVNIPLIENKLAFRGTVTVEDRAGWIDRSVSGEEDVNDSDIKSYRAKLLYTPTDALSITGSAYLSRLDNGGTNRSFEDRTSDTPFGAPSSFNYDVFSATVEYDASSFRFVSATSFLEQDTTETRDLRRLPLDTDMDTETFVQEFRLASIGDGRVHWSAGVYYSDIDHNIVQGIVPFNLLLGSNFTSKSWALFGDVTAAFGPEVDVTVGLRYFEDERTETDLFGPISTSGEFDSVDPRFNIAYRPNDDWMYYFNAAKGFRSGFTQPIGSVQFAAAFGITNLPPDVEEENLWSYEIGAKGTALDGELSVELVAYYLSWKDMQIEVPTVVGLLRTFDNAAEASGPGIEWNLGWYPADEWQFLLSGNWNDVKIKDDVEVTAFDLGTGSFITAFAVRNGDPNNLVPELSLATSGSYSFPLGGSDLSGYLHAGVQYTSERPLSSLGVVLQGESFTNIVLRFGVESTSWAAYIFAENLLDETSVLFPAESSGFPEAVRTRPLTVGVNLKFNWE